MRLLSSLVCRPLLAVVLAAAATGAAQAGGCRDTWWDGNRMIQFDRFVDQDGRPCNDVVMMPMAPRRDDGRRRVPVPQFGFTTGNGGMFTTGDLGPFTTGDIGPLTTFSNSPPPRMSRHR